MTSDADRLRDEIREATAAKKRGDLPEKRYLNQVAQATVDLYRATIAARLQPGEELRLEHHVVRSHLKLNQSVLKETAQEAISLFLTDRRLLRIRCFFLPDQPLTCDDRDGTIVDEVQICDIDEVRVRREIRIGEMAAGAVTAAVAMLFQSWLRITFVFLFLLGILGVLHGLLLPTRWIEVRTAAGAPAGEPAEPIRVFALGKKSGRALAKALLRLRAGAALRGRAADGPCTLASATGDDHDRDKKNLGPGLAGPASLPRDHRPARGEGG
jgi:hypothetical protein